MIAMELLLYFIIYAFFGWCLEVTYAALCSGKFVNRGFLFGPVCPIYGFGVITVVTLLAPLEGGLVRLFLGSVILTSVLEYLTGFLLEKLFHEKWWDYSEIPFNVNGYICPKFSLLWGLACVFIVRLIHPAVAATVGIIPSVGKTVMICVTFSALTADLSLTVAEILNMKKHIVRVSELENLLKGFSDTLGIKISGGVLSAKQKTPDIEAAFAEAQERYREILSQRKNRRLLKAFPNLKKLEKPDMTEKIEKIKQAIADFKENKSTRE